jgi:SPP1 gp7 family putative phage head morphogenesis protein
MTQIPAQAKKEIASAQRDHEMYYGYLDVLENPDVLLQTEGHGKGLRLYDDVVTDAHTSAVLQTRILSVSQQEYEIHPFSEDKRDVDICEYVKDIVKEINLRQLIQDLMPGVLYGFSVVEIIWKQMGLDIVPSVFLFKHPRRFVFDLDRKLRLRTRTNYLRGEEIPDKKFIYLPFGITDSPYGDGLGRRLWWPVWFKKHGVKYFLTFLDKFSCPTPIGYYPENATKEDQNKLLDAISAIQTDTGIIVPEGMRVELLEATRSGKSSYLDFCSYMDAQISKCVLGQTLTTELNEKGSYAASKTHDRVREDIKAADSLTIANCLNQTLVRWIVDLNYDQGSSCPRIVFVNHEEQSLQTAKRDLEIAKAVPVGASYIYEKYNIPEPQKGDVILYENQPKSDMPKDQNFSEGVSFSEDENQMIAYLAKEAMPDIEMLVVLVVEKPDNWPSYFDALHDEKRVEALTRVIFYQYMMGYTTTEEVNFTDSVTGEMTFMKPYDDQLAYFKSKSFVLSPNSYRDVWGAAHAQAFTCARVSDLDILKDVHSFLAGHMLTGGTKKEFRDDMQHWLLKKGWYSNHRWDEEKPSLLPWHLDIIYRNNLATSFQVGRYEQLQQTKAARPYWQYKSMQDASTRPEHAMMHNRIYSADDSFWTMWYPPNGYNCRCFVVSLSYEQAQDRLKEGEKINPDWQGLPDEGWQYNVGAKGLDHWRPDWNRYPGEIQKFIPKKLIEKPEPKAAPKPEPKPEPKAAPKPEPKPEPKVKPVRAPKTKTKPDSEPKQKAKALKNEEQFQAAYDAIVKERGGPGGFVRVHQLRDRLGWPRDQFDRVLRKLEDDRKIMGHHGDPSILTKKQLKDSYYDDEMGFHKITVSWLEDTEPKVKPVVPEPKPIRERINSFKPSSNDTLTKINEFEAFLKNEIGDDPSAWFKQLEKEGTKNRKMSDIFTSEWDALKLGAKEKEEIEERLEKVLQLMHEDIFNQLKENKCGVKIDPELKGTVKGRYVPSNKRIHVQKNCKPCAYMHEYGHHVETITKSSKKSAAWRDSKGSIVDTTKRLHGYDGQAVEYVEEFMTPYMGRIYSGGKHTEIVSCIFEHIEKDYQLDELYKHYDSSVIYLIGLLSGKF